jgi:hypothetical protein
MSLALLRRHAVAGHLPLIEQAEARDAPLAVAEEDETAVPEFAVFPTDIASEVEQGLRVASQGSRA